MSYIYEKQARREKSKIFQKRRLACKNVIITHHGIVRVFYAN